MNLENNNIFLKNKFEFINISDHSNLYNFEISYLDKNLLYVKIFNHEIKNWKEDIKLNIYSIDEKNLEELSIGSCDHNSKEIEFYTDIELFRKTDTNKINIPKNILINKLFEYTNKKDYYDLKYFLYINNFYSFNNNFEIVQNFINENYNNINNLLEYVINDNIKIIVKILFYLNKNGGVFINQNFNNIDIESINKDNNLCYINNNIITIIFSKTNFLNTELLISDLENKNKLCFHKYLNDFEILFDKNIINDIKLNLDNDYFNNIINYENYIFYILSKNNSKYTIEKLPNDYYCLNNEDKIDDDLIVEILNKENKNKFRLDEKYVKNKFESNIIFKL